MPEPVPRRAASPLLGVLLLAVACGRPEGREAEPREVGLRFTDVAAEAGIRFRHQIGAATPRNLLMTMGSGCALFDYDGDGWLDAFLVNGHALDPEDATPPGLPALYRNRGDGTFEDVTERSGTGDPRWSTGAVFLDHDGDGDLDLYVANYARWPDDLEPWGLRKFKGPRFYEDDDDAFLRNEGDGTFADVTAEVGLEPGGKGLTAMASDFDGDGDQDVFVANDRTANHLYENVGGRFRSVAPQAGVAFDANGIETAGMGVDVVDVDGDGLQDIHLTNFRNEYQPESPDDTITYEQPNCLFLGGPDGRFEEVGALCGPDFALELVSRGGAVGDYDRDGDLDLLVSNSGGPAQLFRNETPVGDRWLEVRVRGRSPNTDAIGAKVELATEERTVHVEVRYPATYLSVCDPAIHLGLRPGETGATVEVAFPSGRRATLRVEAGTRAEILEPEP